MAAAQSAVRPSNFKGHRTQGAQHPAHWQDRDILSIYYWRRPIVIPFPDSPGLTRNSLPRDT
jgi:hypothetical protein